MIGVLLSSCGVGGPLGATGSAPPPEPAATSSSPHEAAGRFASLEELFREVDGQLGCPEDSAGHYFMVDGAPTGLPGRQCGSGVVMAWSEDPAMADHAEQVVRDAGGPVPRATGPGWFVADVSAVVETGGLEPTMPDSTDLRNLAGSLGGRYTAG